MNNLKRHGFYQHYTQNGRRIIQSADITDMQGTLHALRSQLAAPALTALNGQRQLNGWQHE